MADLEVTHIDRDGADIDRRIDMLAGPSFPPTPIDEIIDNIDRGIHTYFVAAHHLWTAPLEVKRYSVRGRPFLQTVPDGRYDDNLYSLPAIAEWHRPARRLGRD